jgi:ribosomal protein S18 acetylase RimI-like enzyme
VTKSLSRHKIKIMAIVKLNKNIFDSFYECFRDFCYEQKVFRVSKEILIKTIKQGVRTNFIFCFVEKKVVLGYIIVKIDFSVEAIGRVADITDFYVKKESRQRGIGTALIKYALAFAQKKSTRCVDLMTRKRFQAAQRLYKKFGFKETSLQIFRKKII